MSNITFPIEGNELKMILRKGLTKTNRVLLWPILPSLPLDSITIHYNTDTNDSSNVYYKAEQLHSTLNQPLLDINFQELSLNNSHNDSIQSNTISANYDVKDLEYNKLMFSKLSYVFNSTSLLSYEVLFSYDTLIRILIAIIQRLDLCYLIVKNLLDDKERFMDPSFKAYNTTLYAFKQLLQKTSPKTFSILQSMGALEDKYLDMIFADFFIELLPPEAVLRVIDSFLFEGVKVLYRYGLAIIQAYKIGIKKLDIYQTATLFWHHVKADAVSYANDMGSVMLYKQLGLPEKLPAVDPFAVFSLANNPTFLKTSQIKELPWSFKISRTSIKSLKQSAPKDENNLSKQQRFSTVSVNQNVSGNVIYMRQIYLATQ